MFVFEKNPTSKLDKSGKVLIHCSIVVHDLGTPLKHVEFCLKAKKFNLCLDVGNFANILPKLGEKSLVEVLLLAKKLYFDRLRNK